MTRAGRNPRELSDEERILWNRVAGSVQPLPGRSVPVAPDESRNLAATSALPQTPPSTPRKQPGVFLDSWSPPPPVPRPKTRAIDPAVRANIEKGKLPVDARIDLHGMTQAHAHALLQSFLAEAVRRGSRTVLIITGKGASITSDGILRRSLPEWLKARPFCDYVGGISPAGRRHGGDGAYYVRLKRQGTRP